jgi:dienelactone hydrolase
MRRRFGAQAPDANNNLSRPFDAYAALRYLSQLDFVDPARVAVLGESLGGESALVAVERDMAAQYFAERFRAAIVYYPNCVIPAPSMTAPTLILIGEAGRRIGAHCCRERHGCAIFRRTVSRRNRLLPQLRHPGTKHDRADLDPDWRGG